MDRKSQGKQNLLAGRWGESVVATDLRKKGWTVLEAGFRCRVGEIDLIVRNERYLVFVEVKLRKNAAYGTAAEAVNYGKRQRLRMTAQEYLRLCSEHQPALLSLQPRFDIAEVYAPSGTATKAPVVTYIENAF